MKRLYICLALFLGAVGLGADPSVLVQIEQEVTQLVEKAMPAVVTVRVERPLISYGNNAAVNNVQMQQRQSVANTKGRGQQAGGRTQGHGTGFVVAADGYVVTSLDVVADADRIEVILSDHRRLPARVAGRDPLTNLALLKVDATDLPVLPLGDSDAVRPGAWAVTIGSPLGLRNSVALGVVAGRDRWVNSGSGAQSLLQITGGIAPGTSGAPVLDARGRAIGVITAGMPTLEVNGAAFQQRAQTNLLNQSETWAKIQIDPANNLFVTGGNPSAVTGAGFAVPINIARRVVEDMRAGRTSRPAYLGLEMQPAPLAPVAQQAAPNAGQGQAPQAQVQMPVQPTQQALTQQAAAAPIGVLLTDIITGGPAAKAGLQKGDILVEFAGRSMNAPADLYRAVLERRPGENIPVTYLRAGQKETLMLRLGETPAPAPAENAQPSRRGNR